jgi:ribonuclease R
VHPKELQKLLAKIEGSDEEALISRLTLRSMKQARYTTTNSGHFGLAAGYYCHFTSPIRRYPDLQIHRIIKDNLRGRMNEKKIAHYESLLTEVCKHSSEMERRAEEAERETVKLKKVEYMEEHIGEVFEGVISGVMEWGIFVELPNTVEGLVRVTALNDDYYIFMQDSYELVGENSGNTYKLGQKVKVRVEGTDKTLRTIDFSMVEEWSM